MKCFKERSDMDQSGARIEWEDQAGGDGHSDQGVVVRIGKRAGTCEEWVVELSELSERKGRVISRFLLVR